MESTDAAAPRSSVLVDSDRSSGWEESRFTFGLSSRNEVCSSFSREFQDLTSLKRSNSHLALGVFYTRAGLLNEAEREFQRLVKLNPQSELARKLLQSVRSIRKAN